MKDYSLKINGHNYAVQIDDAGQRAAFAQRDAVKSPLPGTVLAIEVKVGDRVTTGQTLLVLEAMKMENNIDADRGGVVKEISVQQGATVMEGDNLIVIE